MLNPMTFLIYLIFTLSLNTHIIFINKSQSSLHIARLIEIMVTLPHDGTKTDDI